MACQSDGSCPRCEGLPARPSVPWTLYLWPPQGHSGGKIAEALDAGGLTPQTGPDGRALRLDLDGPAARAQVAALERVLSGEELADTRALALSPERSPEFADYPRVTSLARTIAFLRAEPLLDTLQDGAFEVGFAPIAYADDPDDVMAHQARLAFPRLGEPAARVYELAAQADLLHQLDRACRVACIEQGPAQGVDTPIFVEFQPAAIYDPVYCLRTTVATAKQVGVAPENIVFTLSHPNRGYDIKHLQTILTYYRQRGFRVALGQLGSGLGSLELLQHLRPEFAWLSAELIRGVNGDPYRSVIARKLLEMAHRLRVETIGEGGLDEPDRAWLYEHGTDYVALDPAPAAGAGAPAAAAAS
jgi:EAL domain-containing protein (putative c-di-GMP-specific phosphodiesterase class I)